jgi:Tfp pilus assembly protein PilO
VGNLVNLNKFRKRKAKVEHEKKAEINRRLHGRTKLERQRDELQKARLTRGLHGKKLQKGPEDTERDD